MKLYSFLSQANQQERFRTCANYQGVSRKYMCDCEGNVYSMYYANSVNVAPKMLKPVATPKFLKGQGKCYFINAGVNFVFSQEQIVKMSTALWTNGTSETYNTETGEWLTESIQQEQKQEPMVEKDVPHCVIVCHKDHETKVACHIMCESRQKALDYCRDCSTNDHVYKIYKLVDVVTFEPQPSLMHVNPV